MFQYVHLSLYHRLWIKSKRIKIHLVIRQLIESWRFIDTFLFFSLPLISHWKSVLNISNKRFLKKKWRSERGSRLEQHFSKFEIYKGKKLLFHIVFEKGPFTGIRKRFRENIISIKIVGNAILGGVFLMTFFLKRFL